MAQNGTFHPGTLHLYTPSLTAFEHRPPPLNPNCSVSSSSTPQNTILFIGGLGDSPLTVRYPTLLSRTVPPHWTIAEVTLTSSAAGWGTSTLSRDAAELGECVAYFKKMRPSGKIVLMGHSTGCQDVMEYLVGLSSSSRPAIEGAILQAAVSDREGWDTIVSDDASLKESLEKTVAMAGAWVARGDGDAILPKKGNKVLEMFDSPCTAYRAHSLLAKGGDDDYFSTDLSDDTLKGTFGKIPARTKAMFLWGSRDPYIPGHVDQEGTLKRWARIVREGGGNVDEANGGVVRGATHNLNDDAEDIVQDLVGRVVRFIKEL
ncbi:DUF1749-domain-containing protein [Paraphaeosphaeria sporulosa]|uniref:DUF1749-domain-containing protein n=1 Tax=Paraphaeosphaeria sporulosa TaxID=1460663 RepID=A0A177CRE4_9PLEO|nr:DUF1749-domain-containing protein [Paraphaeosphaeria sporulosa]OAG10093.1 DUF1749-domain-containing protein [Paraphaeosphaeria sporulosa]